MSDSVIALAIIAYSMLYFGFNLDDKHVSLKWFFMGAGIMTMIACTAVIYEVEADVPVNQVILDAIDTQMFILILSFLVFCIYLVYGLIVSVMELFRVRTGDMSG